MNGKGDGGALSSLHCKAGNQAHPSTINYLALTCSFRCYFIVMMYGGVTNKHKKKHPNMIGAHAVLSSFTDQEKLSPWYQVTLAALRALSSRDVLLYSRMVQVSGLHRSWCEWQGERKKVWVCVRTEIIKAWDKQTHTLPALLIRQRPAPCTAPCTAAGIWACNARHSTSLYYHSHHAHLHASSCPPLPLLPALPQRLRPTHCPACWRCT